MTRRDLALIIPVLGAVAGSAAADAQSESSAPPLTIHSQVFLFDKLPVHSSSGGAATRPVLHGALPTGEIVEIHETTLMPGQMPHPAHQHVHTEFMLIREGSLEFILDGRSEPFGPGGVAYARSGEMHGLKNVGSTPAHYFVIAIGSQAK